ncbi:uncharacterized protein LOC110707092 [Chenopodium quinoa]|uniref:Uncharacterized protein n=1 Tax=Chenopodium quinoa TaxID=63459 RepID=A0A803LQC9_CHEQI|nr:uncharacterized protein LOC110707092 [Chenopodium quinoa]
MLSLSPTLLFLNPISLSPPSLQNQAQAHPFNGGNPLSFTPPAKQPPLITKTSRPHHYSSSSSSNSSVAEQQEEEQYRVLTATRSEYNNIVILESDNSKVLLLDDSGNVHSILYKTQKWTNSYWDEFTSLPAIIPKGGPIAIFGLGGGTVVHQLLHFWPYLVIDGWELDGILIDRARMYFGMSELEMTTDNNNNGGFLRVCVGDALSPTANVAGGYAGIIVDLFANADVLPELEVAQTWLDMMDKLMPEGRIMVNCGGAKEVLNGGKEWQVNLTIKALCQAFGEEFVNWKKMPDNESGNYLAFTGPLPDLDLWSHSVPEKLSSAVNQWRPCKSLS